MLFGDLSTDSIVLTDADIANGYVEAIAESSATLTLTPTVTAIKDGEELKTECAGYTHTFEDSFDVTFMVGLHYSNRYITFYPSGIACGADSIAITSSIDPEKTEILWLEDAVNLEYTNEDVITYTLYLSNENGDVLSNEVTVTVDTSVTAPNYQYNFNSVNPGNICVTYNDDGTVNIYIDTDFSSDSEEVYYQITLGDIRYTSREPLARIENIPNEGYALHYDVCVDIDGVQYSIYHTTPSGVANEEYFYLETSFDNNVLSMSVDKELINADLNTVRIVSSLGEEIILSEDDFVYNEEYGTYDVSVQFAEYAEEATVYLMANPYSEGIENIDGYLGNERKIFELTVYQP